MKAILVMTMPRSCKNCNLADVDEHGLYCKQTNESISNENDKLESCPLKPMPQKKGPIIETINDYVHIEYNSIYDMADSINAKMTLEADKLIALGYDLCIKEIEE